ncbi:hypothetical protein CUR95_09110 [Bordetella bronchiseptica]|nr:hypothetical protein [Bordetella bronchiseptica]
MPRLESSHRQWSRLQRLLSGKLSQDIAWNLISFAVLAVSGVVVNFIIAATWGAAALGVFNLVFAVYIVLSQVFTFGIHYSSLRHAAHYADDIDTLPVLASSAIVLGVIGGVAGGIFAKLAAPLAQLAFSSERVSAGIEWAAWGLLFFPLNKVLLGLANGLRYMRFFAIAQATRYVAILSWVGVTALAGWTPEATLGAFAISEALVTLLCFSYLVRGRRLPIGRPTRTWMHRHLSFGARGMLAGMFVELNSRVDVLLLGVFLTESAVGVYSFAAMLVDGYYAVLTAVRNNINPILVQAIRDHDEAGLRRLLRNTRRIVYPVMAVLAVLLIAGLAAVVHWILPERGLAQSVPILAILLLGVWIASGIIPMDNVLMQSGRPGWQTVQHATLITANVIFNVALIPWLGLYGAAAGTALAFVAGVSALLYLARRHAGIDMLTGHFLASSTAPRASPGE